MKSFIFLLFNLLLFSFVHAESPEQELLHRYEERLAQLAPTAHFCLAFLNGEFADNKLEQAIAEQEIKDFLTLLYEKQKLKKTLEAKQSKKAI